MNTSRPLGVGVMIPNNRVLWANPTGDIIYSVKCSIPAIWFAETWTLAWTFSTFPPWHHT